MHALMTESCTTTLIKRCSADSTCTSSFVSLAEGIAGESSDDDTHQDVQEVVREHHHLTRQHALAPQGQPQVQRRSAARQRMYPP
jgi:hypothetical protein